MGCAVVAALGLLLGAWLVLPGLTAPNRVGRHTVEFVGARGARYSGSFEMISLKPQQAPIDIILARR